MGLRAYRLQDLGSAFRVQRLGIRFLAQQGLGVTLELKQAEIPKP